MGSGQIASPLALGAMAIALICSGCANQSMVFINSDELCRSWKHQTVSKHDKLTEKTASVIEGNNESRPAWGCVPGENRAAP
jgi:hypothetical protein